jgi:hypothetical protein
VIGREIQRAVQQVLRKVSDLSIAENDSQAGEAIDVLAEGSPVKILEIDWIVTSLLHYETVSQDRSSVFAC